MDPLSPLSPSPSSSSSSSSSSSFSTPSSISPPSAPFSTTSTTSTTSTITSSTTSDQKRKGSYYLPTSKRFCSSSSPEEDKSYTVGIRKYLNEHVPRFSGSVKKRYSDFIVRELSLSGQVVRLTDLTTLPLDPKKIEEPIVFKEEDLLNLVGEKETKEFMEYYNNFSAENQTQDKQTEIFYFRTQLDKEKRTKLHQLIKGLSPLTSETKQITSDSGSVESVVEVKSSKGNKGFKARGNNSFQNGWPRDRPHFLRFVLFKENKDTNDAISVLCSLLRVKPKLFGMAGTKDKRAVTSQMVTAYHLQASQCAGLNKKLFNMRVGNFSYVDKALNLGDLKGNRFTLVIRDVKEEDEVIEQALQNLSNAGFINYFGEQRFGTGSELTSTVGKALLSGQYQTAFQLIVFNRINSEEEEEAARYYKETGDVEGTLSRLPKKHSNERMMFGVLQNQPNAYLNAISTLPRNLRQLYLHSYQSYIWNMAVNERIEKFGLKPVIGDLIAVDSEPVVKGKESLPDEQNTEADLIEEGTERIKLKVKILETEEEVAAASVYDVVLPLPGFSIILPNHSVGSFYSTLLESDGLSFQSFQKLKEYVLVGDYRRIVARPAEMNWSIHQHVDPDQKLTRTDLDELNQTPILPVTEKKSEETNVAIYKSVVVEFNLPTSSYATMCLRQALVATSW